MFRRSRLRALIQAQCLSLCERRRCELRLFYRRVIDVIVIVTGSWLVVACRCCVVQYESRDIVTVIAFLFFSIVPKSWLFCEPQASSDCFHLVAVL